MLDESPRRFLPGWTVHNCRDALLFCAGDRTCVEEPDGHYALRASRQDRLRRRRSMILVSVGSVLFSGCADDCKTSCLPYGTYIRSNSELGVASAKICIDDDCKTLTPGQDDGDGIDGNVTDGFYRSDWTEGRKFTLTIEVLDASGSMVDTLSEDREMKSGGCDCGVLYYDWKDGHLHRVT